MRAIDFQDSAYRAQPTEKLQARLQSAPADNVFLASLKQNQKHEEQEHKVSESEQSKDKLVNKDKEERDQGGLPRKKEEQEDASEDAHSRKRPRSGGTQLVDLDA